MPNPWWSAVLTGVGLVGMFLTMRKHTSGPATGLGIQVVWIVYAVHTHQYPFIASAFGYGSVYAYGLTRWIRQRKTDDHIEVISSEE